MGGQLGFGRSQPEAARGSCQPKDWRTMGQRRPSTAPSPPPQKKTLKIPRFEKNCRAGQGRAGMRCCNSGSPVYTRQTIRTRPAKKKTQRVHSPAGQQTNPASRAPKSTVWCFPRLAGLEPRWGPRLELELSCRGFSTLVGAVRGAAAHQEAP